MSAQTPAKITLEEITQRKKKLLNEIQAQKRAMTATTREIFSPLAPAANKADSLMRSFNTGMAIFDGVVLGNPGMTRRIRPLPRPISSLPPILPAVRFRKADVESYRSLNHNGLQIHSSIPSAVHSTEFPDVSHP